jgi:hypothetical protein
MVTVTLLGLMFMNNTQQGIIMEFCIWSSGRNDRILINISGLEIWGYFADAVIQTAHSAVGRPLE